MQCLVNKADESELPSKVVSFCLIIKKKHVVLSFPYGRLSAFIDKFWMLFTECYLQLI